MAAAVDDAGWEPALQAIADACGARTGQLICQGPAHDIALNLVTGIDSRFFADAPGYGFGDPAANPRLRAGLDAPVMVPVADQDYAGAALRRRSAIYGALFEPQGLAFNCQAVLVRREDLLVRISVTRTEQEGPLDRRAFAAFRALMPAARDAVRLRMALDAARIDGMVRSLDAVGSAALLLDTRGRVIQASQAGEAALVRGDVIGVSDGRVTAVACDDAAATFERALAVSLGIGGEAVTLSAPLPLWSRDGATGLLVELHPMPLGYAPLGLQGAVLMVIRPRRDEIGMAAMLRNRFHLTEAEAAVALRLGEGEMPAAIAAVRGVGLPTVRSQVMAAYAKLGVHHQSALAARLRALREGASG
jgi:DNA-binding CsgD family transcriptional regulator